MSDPNPVSEVLGAPLDPLSQVRELTKTPEAPHEAVLNVSIEDVLPWDVCETVRQYDLDGDALQSLKANIEEHGIKTPLWVTPAKPSKFLLIAGYRRLKAAKELGHKTVPVIVRVVTDPKAARLLAIIENSARDDLGDMDSFRMIEWITRTFPSKVLHAGEGKEGTERQNGRMNVTAIARVTGRSQAWARTHVRTLELYTIQQLEKVELKVRQDRDGQIESKLTWGRVLNASVDPRAPELQAQVLRIVNGESPTEVAAKDATPATPKKKKRAVVREKFVTVSCSYLDEKMVTIKLGGLPKAGGMDTVKIKAEVEIGLKGNSMTFATGEKANSRFTALFDAIASVFTELGARGVEQNPAAKDLEARTAMKTSLDSAVERLAKKLT